jgi:glycerophosphoryl diester phosphodiesterase
MLPPLYAHRLGRAYGPDSSAVALRGALAAGVDGLESDVCLTADGALVLLHDPYLALGTDLEGFAHQRTARELRRARLRDREGRLTAEAPLFVEDLLAAVPRELVVQLEVKAHADPALATRTVNALAERLRGRRRGRRVEVLSFTSTACARAAALGYSARLVVWADYAPAALVRWARRHGVGGVCVEHFLLSAALMGALRRGGLSVTTGTLDEPALLERLLPLRPDAVTSDRPHALREAAAGVPSLAA